MNKNRLESFSDGVFAIIITIMVLEIKIPHTNEWSELRPLIPSLASYFISFIFLGIYWANHHHLIHSVKQVSVGIIWANLNLLFWLSLTPVATGWMGENHFASNTVAVYGAILFLSGGGFFLLMKTVEKNVSDSETFERAFRKLYRKGKASSIGYTFAILFAFVSPVISGIIFLVIAIVWLVPDKNIEKAIKSE